MIFYNHPEPISRNLVPNIVVLDYLTRAKRITPSIKSKAVKHIESGYQRELTFRRDDGSFSAFGKSDKAGSTWLTAYVVKSFIQARPYIDMDKSVVTKGIEFLFSRQNEDGSFAELGEVHNKALQGGSAVKLEGAGSGSGDGSPPDIASKEGSAALTAYVLIAILYEDKSEPVIKENALKVKQAENFIYK